jgi:hypothetical protein
MITVVIGCTVLSAAQVLHAAMALAGQPLQPLQPLQVQQQQQQVPVLDMQQQQALMQLLTGGTPSAQQQPAEVGLAPQVSRQAKTCQQCRTMTHLQIVLCCMMTKWL